MDSSSYLFMGDQVTPEVGTLASPKKRKPFPFELMQWPKTCLVITPWDLSCESSVTFPLPSPRMPFTGVGTLWLFFPWLYPQLHEQASEGHQSSPLLLVCGTIVTSSKCAMFRLVVAYPNAMLVGLVPLLAGREKLSTMSTPMDDPPTYWIP